MSLYQDGTEEVMLATDQTMAADFQTPKYLVGPFDMGAIQAVWTGVTPSLILPAKLQVEASLDGVNWCNVFPDAYTKKITLTDGCVMYTLQNVEYKWLRVSLEKRSNSGGIVSLFAYMKRRRANNP